MNETQLVNGFDCQDTLRHVEFGYIFRERIVLDKPMIESATGLDVISTSQL